MTVTPAQTKIIIPASLTATQQAAIAAANPDVGIVCIDIPEKVTAAPPPIPDALTPAEQSDTAAHAFHPKEVSAIAAVVENVAPGVITFIPPPFGPIAALAVKWGLPALLGALSKDPTKERWPIDDLDALCDSVELPKT